MAVQGSIATCAFRYRPPPRRKAAVALQVPVIVRRERKPPAKSTPTLPGGVIVDRSNPYRPVRMELPASRYHEMGYADAVARAKAVISEKLGGNPQSSLAGPDSRSSL